MLFIIYKIHFAIIRYLYQNIQHYPNVTYYPSFYLIKYTVSQEFPDSVKNMLLSKNPQFLPYHYEILIKEGTHEDLILTKFRNNRIKIVDFLIKAYF